MNDYTGKVCPYCKTTFSVWDDIVVCSDCDMPHHRQCWIDNQTCTTFGCLGTIRNDDSPSSSVTAIEITFDDWEFTPSQTANVYCGSCGCAIRSGASFCTQCGRPLNSGFGADPSRQNHYIPNNHQAPMLDPLLSQLVGTNSEYYLPKFQMLQSADKMTSWNWAAFFFGAYWMIYRKMYLQGGLAMLILFILSLIPGDISWLLLLACYIALGIFGDYLYLQHLKTQIDHLKTIHEAYRSPHIVTASGTNLTAAILSMIGYCIIVAILVF